MPETGTADALFRNGRTTNGREDGHDASFIAYPAKRVLDIMSVHQSMRRLNYATRYARNSIRFCKWRPAETAGIAGSPRAFSKRI